MSRYKLKQNIIDIFLRNLEGSTLQAMADEIIDASYAALKEPTEEMRLSGINNKYIEAVDWVSALFGTGVVSYETIMTQSYKDMLAASPLAPEDPS